MDRLHENPAQVESQLPSQWRKAVESALQPAEKALEWFVPNLNEQLQFNDSLIILTHQRLLWLVSDLSSPPQPAITVTSLPLTAEHALFARESAGLGSLELVLDGQRSQIWRFTANRMTAANRLVKRLKALQFDGRGESMVAVRTVCPSCGAIVANADEDCPVCTQVPPERPAATLVRLFEFARPRARMIALGTVLAIASTAASLVPPYLTMPILDKVLIPHQNGQPVDFSLVRWYLSALFGAAIVAWLLGWARTFVFSWVSERISADLRNRTYAHLQRLSLEFFGGKRTGDLMSRVGSDTDRICNFLSIYALDFASDVLMITLTACILLSIDPLLALVTLCPLPLIAWVMQIVRKRLLRGFQNGSRAWSHMTSVLADTIPGIRVVKAFAQERREIERFERANDHVLDTNDRVNTVWSFFGPMVTLLTESGLLVIWAFGAWRVSHDYITVGVLTAFLAYITRFYTRLESMSRMLAAIQRAAASTHRIFEILDRVPSVAEPLAPVACGELRGELELRDVGFHYGARKVLHDLTLKIRPGEMIGLVGSSGAGKSTLVNLVCRFYDVNEGAILVDGVDIRSYAVEDYRQNIGIVLQEPFLFYGTIAENIAYGRPDATRSEIIAAARAARAHEFILRLPEGYDSIVGERGQKLSGGERQRISIARALLIDPKILILDEATSSVDTETEREIQEALDNLIRGRTTIAIAHRLSTLRKADRLVVLERGRIAEVGQHDELLLSEVGAYARLHKAQMELATGEIQ